MNHRHYCSLAGVWECDLTLLRLIWNAMLTIKSPIKLNANGLQRNLKWGTKWQYEIIETSQEYVGRKNVVLSRMSKFMYKVKVASDVILIRHFDQMLPGSRFPMLEYDNDDFRATDDINDDLKLCSDNVQLNVWKCNGIEFPTSFRVRKWQRMRHRSM